VELGALTSTVAVWQYNASGGTEPGHTRGPGPVAEESARPCRAWPARRERRRARSHRGARGGGGGDQSRQVTARVGRAVVCGLSLEPTAATSGMSSKHTRDREQYSASNQSLLASTKKQLAAPAER
jgi:hypothetical protein